MKLVVFDLDGTLTRTSRVDSECYERALLEVAGVRDPRTDWSTYEHATDTGIVDEIFRERFGRSPGDEECGNIRDRLIQLFEARCAVNGLEFAEVPGAGAFVKRLLGDGWGVALATGSWRCSAEFKIQRSGLPAADLPSAFAEDGPSREGILRAAIERAQARYDRATFQRVIAVGDGVWDVRAAAKVGLPFLGIAEERAASTLRAQGASHVLENYLDFALCLRSLDEARVPAREDVTSGK